MQDSFTIMVFEVNREYIAQNLCEQKEVENNTCKGCCQLKKQMKDHSEQEQSNPNQGKPKLIIDFFASAIHSLCPFNPSIDFNYYTFQNISLNRFNEDIFHPPQYWL